MPIDTNRLRAFVKNVHKKVRNYRAQNKKLEEKIAKLHSEYLRTQQRLSRTRDLERKIRELEEESQLDLLTGIYNKKGFDQHFQGFLKQLADYERFAKVRNVKERERPIGIFVFLDFDLFKCVNELLTKSASDVILQMFANYLKTRINRVGDIFGRLHGDEFMIFFRGISDIEVIRKIMDEDIRPTLRNIVPPGYDDDVKKYMKQTGTDYLVDATYASVIVASPQLDLNVLLKLAGEQISSKKNVNNDARSKLFEIAKRERRKK